MNAGLYMSIIIATSARSETLWASLSMSFPINTNKSIKAARITEAPSPVIIV